MISPTHYHVLSAIIRDQFVSDGVDHLCIDQRVYPQDPSAEAGVSFNQDIERNKDYLRLFDSWWEHAPAGASFEAKFDLEVPYDLWDRGSESPFSDPNGLFSWSQFYERHPSSAGLIDCSSVRSASGEDLWIAHIGCLTGGKAGRGHFYFYQGGVGDLQFKDKFGTWIS